MIPLPDSFEKAKAALTQMPATKSGKSGFVAALEDNGLGLDSIAQNVSMLANFASDDALKLKANELAMRAYDVLRETNEGKAVTINIQIVDSEVNIADLCTPRG